MRVLFLKCTIRFLRSVFDLKMKWKLLNATLRVYMNNEKLWRCVDWLVYTGAILKGLGGVSQSEVSTTASKRKFMLSVVGHLGS